MPCTTILAGKNATYDGSTFAARNEDSGAGRFNPKKLVVVQPEEQPRLYRSVLSHLEIPLPDRPLRYTAMPNALPDEGIWGAAGVNAENVAMTATETITSNPRVLAADPLVRLHPGKHGKPEVPGGIGEEDMLTLILPYIHSAREGVLRLGQLLETYGTWEMNGIAFQDAEEVWWLETIGGHHWIARRVPDDAYVFMPNQFGMDRFDLDDAFGAKKEHLCSPNLRSFLEVNHLDTGMGGDFNPRLAFGSHSDADHVYNTPRAWYGLRYFNPSTFVWDGPAADFRPDSDDLPWCLVPERKLTPEDVKYILSSHYQGTPFDPYAIHGNAEMRGAFRPIGVNRNNFLALTQIRPGLPEDYRALEWLAFGSNVFNAFVPLYANVEKVPKYFSNTGKNVTTESFYWCNRLIAALADSAYQDCIPEVERYAQLVPSKGLATILEYDRIQAKDRSGRGAELRVEANKTIARMLRKCTEKLLAKVLYKTSLNMKNGYTRSDG